jgi:hypothetical protein
MLFSQICKILNCPTNVVAVGYTPKDAILCEDFEKELFGERLFKSEDIWITSWQCDEDVFDYWEHINDYDY